MALALSRKQGQSIKIGDNIVVTIGETRGSYTTVLVEAPKDIPVARIEGNTNGNGSGSGDRAGRKRASKVLHGLPSEEGRGCATAGAEAGESDGGDSSAADTAHRCSRGAAFGRESD